MYSVKVQVEGVSPLLHNRYPLPDFETLNKGGRRQPGELDHSQEWRKALYVNSDGEIYQPATHFDGAMTKAASGFRVQGQGQKTYSQLFKGNVFTTPDEILFGMKEPEDLDNDADKQLYLDIRPVVIQRARIVKVRPCFKAGWRLEFIVDVIEEQIPVNVLNEVLVQAGKTAGIGDFRPKFGRFMVTKFEVSKNGK